MTGAQLRDHAFAMLGSFQQIAGRLWSTFPTLTGVFKTGLSMQIDARSVAEAFLPAGFPDDFDALAIPPAALEKGGVEILRAGAAAPNGGNRQNWCFLVVKDPKVKLQ